MENVINIIGTSTGVVELLRNSNNRDEKLEALKRKLKQLSSRHMDVNTEVEHAENQGKKQRREVENWSINVKRIENKVQSIEQARQESGVFSRAFKLGNQVEKLIGEVEELVDQGRFPQGLTLDVMETRGYLFVTTKLVGKEFQRYLDKIWENLMEVNVLSIGIHGMGGVGKTTLAMHIHNRLLEKCDSFNVYWVTVSQDFSIKKLQTDIAKVIKLDLSDEYDVKKRAARLAEALRRRTKLVLILDDVWKYFSLQEVGIPVEVNGCKLILTSRFLDVCEKMGCSKKVRVMLLNEEEAWNLFMEKFGNDVTLPLEVQDIAGSIAKECAGLPLGIITMARSMRGVGIDIHGWRNALEELKYSKAGPDDMEGEVFQVLKFSYSSLKDPKLQECFLYCSLYPEDSKIRRDELIERLIDEGIIERKRNRQAEFDKGHSMLNTLENACLLEGVENWEKKKCVKMHDLLRDMAIQIAQDDHRFMVKAGKGLEDLPDEEEWKDDLVKVSLMENKISKIPSNASPRCPKLSTLMLNHNFVLEGIPYSFFAHMPELKVLDLSYNEMEYLPESISNLENLTALVLKGFKLKHVPSLAKLTSLRTLDLNRTYIDEFPQGLEMLVNLRYLRIAFWDLDFFFPTGILPKFSHLQYLEFSGTFKAKVKVEEVACLKKLETFEGQLFDLHDFNTYVKFLEEKGGPTNYRLFVGSIDWYLDYIFYNERDKMVSLSSCNISKSGGVGGGGDTLVLPKDVQFLALESISDIRSLCDVPSFNNATELKNLLVNDCNEIDHILSSCILPLRSSPIPPGTFSQLKKFTMDNCGNIKKLFTPALLQYMQNLEMICARNCEKLVEIIGASSNEVEEEEDNNMEERNKVEGMDTSKLSLPNLRKLFLFDLPELKSICSSSQVMFCDSIQVIDIYYCPKLKRLPLFLPLLNGQLCPPRSLKRIGVNKECWESLEWDNPNSKTVLESVLSS